MSDFQPGLSASQYQALQTALRQRVALIQGPPGTGKTFLGCKIAEYFVRLKNAKPSAFPGPVLVVAASNHTIREFLQRCTSLSAKVVHAYSPFHEREDHGALQREYDACESWDQRRQIMKGAEILAMTTSRAAYMRRTLDQLDIKIVIVEEAAAVLESHVLACITADSEHIIQMGDHKQLRPSAAHPMLNRDFRVGVSQFERLVGNGADCPMLNEQRRMRPEVADLVRPLYPELTDHQCTRGRPPLDGVDLKIPVCLLRHEFPETKDGSSYSNHHEAAMAVELASYLIEAGSKPESITILTTYRRQLIHIVKSIQLKGGDISKLRVSTVDGYQGEENSVIILSIVRSNDSGDIGFIRHENRACVALSRARDGFFILGNVDCMTTQKGQTLWTHVRATLSAAVRLRSRLPLVCAHGLRFLAQTPREVKGATRGCAVCQYRRPWRRAARDKEEISQRLEDAREKLELCKETLGESGLDEEEQRKKEDLRDAVEELVQTLESNDAALQQVLQTWSRVEEAWKTGAVSAITDTVDTIASRLRVRAPPPEEDNDVVASVPGRRLARRNTLGDFFDFNQLH